MYDAIIIGGGASGLAAANTAKKRGKSILVLEGNERVGRKISVAGNGKCNISNVNISVENYNNPFVEPFLKRGNVVGEFFRSLGIVTKSIENRIYPYTESGNTVLNLLRKNISDDILTGIKVEDIVFSDGVFSVNGYKSKKIIVCTGGITSGGFDSYNLLEKFGHTKTPVYPVLTPLKSDVTYVKSLAGIRVKAELTLFTDGKKIRREKGELLFKDNGLSGIVSMVLSRYIDPRLYNEIRIDFVPEYSAKELSGYDLEGFLQKAVLNAVNKQASVRGISAGETAKNFIIKDVKLGSLSTAQVTRGGISTDGFTDRCESKIIPGLFACGEVLDVDGECGGYNLHWAFLSGITAGECV